MEPGEVTRKFGTWRAFQIIGFCQLWRYLGAPSLDELSAHVRQQFAEKGVTKSAAYRYVEALRAWNAELGRKPEDLDDLALQVAAVFDVSEQPQEQPVRSRVSHRGERVVE